MLERAKPPGQTGAASGTLQAAKPAEHILPLDQQQVNMLERAYWKASLQLAANKVRATLDAIPAPSETSLHLFGVWQVAQSYTARELRQIVHDTEIEAMATAAVDAPDAGFWQQELALVRDALAYHRKIEAEEAPKPRSGKHVDYQAFKANTDIVDTIRKYTQLRKQGRSWVGLCPFHDDHKRPNLVVWSDPPVFKCYTCDAKGDVITFLKKIGAEVA